MIDYKLIEQRLEDALSKETRESLLEWLKNHETQNQEDQRSVNVDQRVKPACERKLIISIENDTVLFDNLNEFKPLEFMGILHNAVSTADVLYKTKVMRMVEKASKSV